MSAPADERVEVVDEAGGVIGVVSRAEMRAANLRHRAVFVAVRSPAGTELLVHRRAEWKDVFPGAWDVAFGGVLAVGETWAAAARRELAEEAGVVAAEEDLRFLGAGAYDDDRVRLVAQVFEVRSPGPFTFTDDEVVAVEWIGLAGLDRWLAGHDVVPDSAAIVVPLLPRSFQI